MLPIAYPFILLLAILTGGFLLRRSQSDLRLSAAQRSGIGVAAFCGAMIGAKLPFVIWDLEGLRSGAAWFSNGKTIMCGIVGAYFAVEVAKYTLGVKTKTGDSFAVPVAITVAIGRLGCFAAGCCYGTPTELPWGIRFPNVDALARHPTQLYESIFHGTAAVTMVFLQRNGLFKGQLVKLYIIAYLAYRLLSEQIRPEPRFWMGLTSYQWFAIILIPIFLLLWWRDSFSNHTEDLPTELQNPEA